MARQDVKIRKRSPYRIQYSLSADRSSPADLDGTAVSQSIYVFVTPTTGILSVRWIKDPSDDWYQTDSSAPFDLIGNAGANALPFDVVSTLTQGRHLVTALITTADATYSETALFDVNLIPTPDDAGGVASVNLPTITATHIVVVLTATAAAAATQPTALITATSGGSVLTADSGATAKTQSLLSFLKLRGVPGATNRVISGQYARMGPGFGDGSAYTSVNTSFGVNPGVLGVEWDVRTDYNATPNYTPIISVIQTHYNAGGIVSINAHPPNVQTNGNYSNRNLDMVQITTPGTTLYNLWRSQVLDKWAVGFQALQALGIPAVFVLFHESTSSSFWWTYSNTSGTMTPALFKTLYQQSFTYLTQTKGIHNLLYAFELFCNDFKNLGKETYYPGDAYVDILGNSCYQGTSWTQSIYDSMSNWHNNHSSKVFAFTEMGKIPGGANYDMVDFRDRMQNVFPYAAYWMNWSDQHALNSVNMLNGATILNDVGTMNRNEISY